MFRSKSFNIPRPATLGSLTHAKSVSDIGTAVIDARIFITIKEVSASEAVNVTNRLMTTTMNSEWKCDEFVHSLDNEQEKWNMRYFSAYKAFTLMHKNAKISEINALFFAAYFKGIPVGILQFYSGDNGTYEYLISSVWLHIVVLEIVVFY
ncbi:hypothetical protein IQ209_08830 [Xenorhabdus sp. BG5]|nr:hypothetical protein [Xenorhabdus sp. BG5]